MLRHRARAHWLRAALRATGLLLGLLPALALAQSIEEPRIVVVVDSPADGAGVPATVVLSGWAADVNSEAGTGVDRLEVYLDGQRGAGALLGAPSYGLLRADVGLVRRHSRYNASGWALETTLAPGTRTLYIYAHAAGQSDEQGWSTPLVLTLQVEANALAPAPDRPSGSSGAGAAAAAATPAAAAASQSTIAGCQLSDRDSGRCLVRANRVSAAQNATANVMPGSWTATRTSAPGSSSNERPGATQGEISLLAGMLSSNGLTYGVPVELLNLAGRPPAATSGNSSPVGASVANPAASASVVVTSSALAAAPAPAAAAPGAVAPLGSVAPAAPSISLSATQTGRGQFTLSWNQVGGGAIYEVRRCPAQSTSALACSVVAVLQSSSYTLAQAEGTYFVRAVTPQGQLQGESNRLQLCCRG